jgi:hypothetical protein
MSPSLCGGVTIKEFDSEKVAYEYGLQKVGAWIDEHAPA